MFPGLNPFDVCNGVRVDVAAESEKHGLDAC